MDHLVRVRLCFVLSAALGAPSARAQSAKSSEPLALDFDAPTSCGTAQAFFASLQERVPVRPANADERGRTLRVRISQVGSRFNGSFRMISASDESSSPRELDADSCASVTNALLLSAALAIDPHAALTHAATSPKTDEAPAALPNDAPKQPEIPASPPDNARSAHPRSESPLLSGVNIGVALLGGGGTGVAFGPSVVGHLALGRAEFRFGAEVLFGGSIDAASVGATFVWINSEFDFCPTSFSFGAVTFLPCGSARIGILHAEGAGTPDAHGVSRPWLEPSAMGLIRIAASKSLEFSMHGGVGVPLVRSEFLFDPGATVYKAPAVIWHAGASAGLLF